MFKLVPFSTTNMVNTKITRDLDLVLLHAGSFREKKIPSDETGNSS